MSQLDIIKLLKKNQRGLPRKEIIEIVSRETGLSPKTIEHQIDYLRHKGVIRWKVIEEPVIVNFKKRVLTLI